MPYTRAWDETTPPGTAQANTLETIIQNFKVDLRERLVQVIPEWSNEAVDPKRIKVLAGIAANRPAPAGLADGIIYYSTDTNKFEIIDGAAWVQLSPLDTSLLPTSVVRVLGRQNVQSSVTGTIIETTLSTVPVLANTLGVKGWLRVIVHIDITGSNSKTFKISLGATPVFSRTGAFLGPNSYMFECWIWNKDVTNSQDAQTLMARSAAVEFVDPPGGAVAEDTTVDKNITFKVTLSNAADSVTLRSMLVEAMPS